MARGCTAGSQSSNAKQLASTFALDRNLPLVDAQLALAALAVLPGDGGRSGAEALIDLADRYGLHRVDRKQLIATTTRALLPADKKGSQLQRSTSTESPDDGA